MTVNLKPDVALEERLRQRAAGPLTEMMRCCASAMRFASLLSIDAGVDVYRDRTGKPVVKLPRA